MTRGGPSPAPAGSRSVTGRASSCGVEGRNTGRLKTIRRRRPAAHASASRSAATRAVVHQPCAMADRNPKALAGSACRWIGFTSPVTRPNDRPVPSSAGTATGSSQASSRCGAATSGTVDSSAPPAWRLRERVTARDVHTGSPSTSTSPHRSNSKPERTCRPGPTHARTVPGLVDRQLAEDLDVGGQMDQPHRPNRERQPGDEVQVHRHHRDLRERQRHLRSRPDDAPVARQALRLRVPAIDLGVAVGQHGGGVRRALPGGGGPHETHRDVRQGCVGRAHGASAGQGPRSGRASVGSTLVRPPTPAPVRSGRPLSVPRAARPATFAWPVLRRFGQTDAHGRPAASATWRCGPASPQQPRSPVSTFSRGLLPRSGPTRRCHRGGRRLRPGRRHARRLRGRGDLRAGGSGPRRREPRDDHSDRRPRPSLPPDTPGSARCPTRTAPRSPWRQPTRRPASSRPGALAASLVAGSDRLLRRLPFHQDPFVGVATAAAIGGVSSAVRVRRDGPPRAIAYGEPGDRGR